MSALIKGDVGKRLDDWLRPSRDMNLGTQGGASWSCELIDVVDYKRFTGWGSTREAAVTDALDRAERKAAEPAADLEDEEEGPPTERNPALFAEAHPA